MSPKEIINDPGFRTLCERLHTKCNFDSAKKFLRLDKPFHVCTIKLLKKGEINASSSS